MSERLRAVWAVVPVKAFSQGKSRLGAVLSDPVREAFARALFAHVMATFEACPAIAGVAVVSSDDEVRGEAEARGARVVCDPSGGTLADVVDAGLAQLRDLGASAAIVCMADLPRLSVSELEAVCASLEDHDVVLAPDAHGLGTNVCAMVPPLRFHTRFGRADSFAQHVARAEALGLRLAVLKERGLCFDVDAPEDLAAIE